MKNFLSIRWIVLKFFLQIPWKINLEEKKKRVKLLFRKNRFSLSLDFFSDFVRMFYLFSERTFSKFSVSFLNFVLAQFP